jgi:23S rRNA pseudouridine2605 synthase
MEKRLQKILSEMGIASRRKAEDLIIEGRVTVNGMSARLGMKADPDRDHIKLDGKLLSGRKEPKVYMMFYKPRNVVTSLEDPQDRPTVKDYLGKVRYRVYPVGRLDFDSEGLLLITNDGDFAHAVLHPSKEVPKTYEVKIDGALEDADIQKLRRGVSIEGGRTAPARVRKLRKLKSNSWIEVIIHEGKKRQIRRMLQKVGHHVLRLKRSRIGPLKLGSLRAGDMRELTKEELEAMREKLKGRDER